MTAARVVLRREAKRDIARHYRWLQSEVGTETAENFLAAADRTFGELARVPRMGPGAGSHKSALEAVRKWQIDGFPRMKVFYVPLEKGIRIIRVLHAEADRWALLDID